MKVRRTRASIVRLGCSLLVTVSACHGSDVGGELDSQAVVDANSDSQRPETAIDAGGALDNQPTRPDSASPELDAGLSQRDASLDAASDADTTGCGDGKLQAGEVCDDGNSAAGDGCSADCHSTEQDYVCPSPGRACITTVKCGDGRISGRENCDDGNARSGDGCSDVCMLEAGFACLQPAAACAAARCGDGIVAGKEECDDGEQPAISPESTAQGDGCSASCRLEPGYVCPRGGDRCRPSVCNDGIKEGSEPCDDGNQTVGDGCTPFCEVEPDCSAGACRSRCGDGLILPNDNEACDDGNTKDHDGCSADCRVEPGYVCSFEQRMTQDVLSVPVTYRDFIAVSTVAPTHPDFEVFGGTRPTLGLVKTMLDGVGKPVFAGICDDSGLPYPTSEPLSGPCPYNQQLTTSANFDQWYRDVPAVNRTKVARMMLTRDPGGRSYQISNASFFPWDGDPNGWVGQGREQLINAHDFGFTSEIRHYFEYQADQQNLQTLSFSGDDDVWVFINRRLAVDIGGLHAAISRSVTLDAPAAQQLGLESGKIYEIALFHAERHSGESNFNLTLDGFEAGQTHCQTKCGDGVVAGDEACDDGKNDGSYGSCTTDCRRAAFCGDAKLDVGNEACDDGINQTTYSANGQAGCAPGCKLSAYCGDGRVDSLAGEACDDRSNRGGYGECGSDCQLGPRCGDRIIQADAGEACDDGNRVNGDSCSSVCRIEAPE